MTELKCFKAYDIRGEIGTTIDPGIAYRIGRAVAQHLDARSIVVGFDARETSPNFARAVTKGICDFGSDVVNIGLAGTEEMYWAVTQFGACAGIEVTASHNPINYNGMKIVKVSSKPLDEIADFQAIKSLAENSVWSNSKRLGAIVEKSQEARKFYVEKVLSFINPSRLKPLTVVVNSGNGAAGPTFDAIASRLSGLNVPLEFIRINHEPDSTFPNGIPNPLLSKNHSQTRRMVRQVKADFGVAFDGDFDRCFFFDEQGQFVPGEFVVGLLASIFLKKESGAAIVYDPRVVMNTQDVILTNGGKGIQSKTGHAFIKQAMRSSGAIYGGEISAHHYFRDFACCDSGMIPWLLVAELISCSRQSLGALVKNRIEKFPSLGEINFQVTDADASINNVLEAYRENSVSLDETDGISLLFNNWRFNLRRSNTEPLVRLNIESRGNSKILKYHSKKIQNILGGVVIQ